MDQKVRFLPQGQHIAAANLEPCIDLASVHEDTQAIGMKGVPIFAIGNILQSGNDMFLNFPANEKNKFKFPIQSDGSQALFMKSCSPLYEIF